MLLLLLACSPMPKSADEPIEATPARWADLAAGDRSTCGVTGAGDVWCWGTIPAYTGTGAVYVLPGPYRVDGLPPVARLSISRNLHCATFVDGTTGCWDGAAWTWAPDADVITFAGPLAALDAVDVVAADYALYTLGADGRVTERFDPATPYADVLTGRATVAASRWLDVCGLDAAGAPACADDLAAVPDDAVFTTLAVGAAEACGLDAAGGMTCWTPDGVRPDDADLPALADIGLGYGFGCGLDRDGGAACWGDLDPRVGDLGVVADAELLTVGIAHACVADADPDPATDDADATEATDADGEEAPPPAFPGGVWCWGDNADAQLGDTATAGGPVAVHAPA